MHQNQLSLSDQDLFAECLDSFFEPLESHCLSLLSVGNAVPGVPPAEGNQSLCDICFDEAKLELAGEYLCACIDKSSFRGRAFFALGLQSEKQGKSFPLFQYQVVLQSILDENPHYQAILKNIQEKTDLLRAALNEGELALAIKDQRQSPWCHPQFEVLMYQLGRRFCRYFSEIYEIGRSFHSINSGGPEGLPFL